MHLLSSHTSVSNTSSSSGYLQSCCDIVTFAHHIVDNHHVHSWVVRPRLTLRAGDASVNVYKIGDWMSKEGWHLNALNRPAAVHIACTRLTLQVVETFISDLKASVVEAKNTPEGKGMTVALRCGVLSFVRVTPYASLTLY